MTFTSLVAYHAWYESKLVPDRWHPQLISILEAVECVICGDACCSRSSCVRQQREAGMKMVGRPVRSCKQCVTFRQCATWAMDRLRSGTGYLYGEYTIRCTNSFGTLRLSSGGCYRMVMIKLMGGTGSLPAATVEKRP